MTPEEELPRVFTGMVAASLVVEPDVEAGTVGCDRCRERLASGDDVRATVCCYDNHSWELLGVFCPTHGVESVPGAMGVAAEDQAVLAAVLERTGYRDPTGSFHPEALTLGAVDVLDFSPAEAGY